MNGSARSGLSRRNVPAMRTGIALVVSVLLGAPAAHAGDWRPVDKRDCFARSEVRQMGGHAGWDRGRLERWTETRDGAEGASTGIYYERIYRGCTAGDYVSVTYRASDDTWVAVGRY